MAAISQSHALFYNQHQASPQFYGLAVRVMRIGEGQKPKKFASALSFGDIDDCFGKF
jgi:hypothetical protein